jgi:cob(I)alamin adenosyltransferase
MQKKRRGYIHVYTGDGKGKTTAALGLALRAAGAGMKICIIQFAKATKCSEHKALERFADCITVRQFGTGTFIVGKPSFEDIRLARDGLAAAGEAMSGGVFGVVILDEIMAAVSCGLLSAEDVLAALQNRRNTTEVILTGRKAPQQLIDIADLVTEMKEVKHYFSKGVKARVGIEK